MNLAARAWCSVAVCMFLTAMMCISFCTDYRRQSQSLAGRSERLADMLDGAKDAAEVYEARIEGLHQRNRESAESIKELELERDALRNGVIILLGQREALRTLLNDCMTARFPDDLGDPSPLPELIPDPVPEPQPIVPAPKKLEPVPEAKVEPKRCECGCGLTECKCCKPKKAKR